MLRGTITVRDGMAIVLTSDDASIAIVLARGGDPISQVLVKLAREGWIPEGELPFLYVRGEFTIPIFKALAKRAQANY